MREKYKNTVQLGRTIVAEREKTESESERLQARQKAKNKKVLLVAIALLVIAVIVMGIVTILVNFIIKARPDENARVEIERHEPTIEIVDESNSGYVTERMREYIGRVEKDLIDNGQKAVRAVIPVGKAREVDIYIEGRKEYYKMNLDRGTAVSVEDAIRMMKYLDERALSPTYVDVRIEGKAYYQ